MGRMLAEFAERARPKLIAVQRRVYRVKPVNSMDLAHVGYAHLEGSASYQEALQSVARQAQRLREEIAGLPLAEREQREEQHNRQAREFAQRRLEILCSTPQGEAALDQRAIAYIVAAVTGAGRIKDGIEAPEVGVVAEDGDPSLVLEDNRDDEQVAADVDPIWIESLQFVADEKQQDYDKGRVWVGILTAEQRMLLGTAIQTLQSVSGRLEPFRLRAGGSAGAGLSGEALPDGTVGGAGARSVSDGAAPPVRRGRAAGRAGRRQG